MFGQCIYFNLNKTTRLVNKVWDQAFAKAGVSPSHGYLLLAVGRAEQSPTTAQLREFLQLDLSTVSRFIDALEKKGLLIRSASAEDKRVKVITFTDQGEKTFEQLNEIAKMLFSKIRTLIDEQEVEQMVSACKSIADQLEQV